jgi:starch-binding outer membrane protein, SusD/RagB family
VSTSVYKNLKTMKSKYSNHSLKAFMACLLLSATACQDFLELAPQSSLSDATAYSTPERVALSVTGMYDAAQSGYYAGNAVRGYPFGSAHVEQGDCRGEDMLNTQLFYAVTYESTYDPTTANNDFHWQTLYSLINRCNIVLDNLEKATPVGSMTQDVINGYKGEARFLRALAHHELVKHFARPYSDNPTAANSGIPVRLEPVTSGSEAEAEAAASGRETVQEVYDVILADLDYAETVLPETRASASLRISRATKAAAVGLKTRVYLHMGQWSKVVAEGNKLAPQNLAPFNIAAGSGYGAYSLPSNPYAAFSSAGSKNNTESIFSIENSDVDNAGVNGALPAMYTTSNAPTSGRALVAISPLIYNQSWFLATDARKSSTFITGADTGGGRGAFFTRKYTDVTARSDNAPVIRYAEVLLNMAEAIQRQTGTVDSRAFAMYNAVRGRANAAGTDALHDQISDFGTANALIQAILNERRIEFLAEGLRWGDIHRLAQDATFNTWGGGIPAKVNRNISNYTALYTGNPVTNTTIMTTPAQNHAAIAYSNYKFVWPIPNSETVLNPVLANQQNPGY